MASRTIQFDKCAMISSVNQATHYTPGSIFEWNPDIRPNLLIKTTESIDSIKYRELVSFTFYLYASEWLSTADAVTYTFANLSYWLEPFDENTVTFATAPGYPSHRNDVDLVIYKDAVPGWAYAEESRTGRYKLINLIKNGGYLSPISASVATPNSNYKPYIIIEYSDSNVGLTVTPTYPTAAATISKALDTTFSWSAVPTSSYLVGDEVITPKTTKFRWRYAGASTYTEVSVGTARTYTVAAGTFKSGTLEWQVAVTSNSDITTTTPWTSVEIKEPVPSTVIVSPKNAVLDAAVPVTFQWSHVISNGTPQTKYDLQTSPDASAWTTIRTESTPQTSTVFEANTLVGGDLYWRVRTYNSDGISGDWSEAAHCIVIAAPDAPVIAITRNAPRFAIRWQQTGQRAYEIRLDGEVILKKFGLETSYEYGSYLEDGVHTVTVRIQNQYSLWSDWGSTDIVVGNNEGDAVRLSADAGDAVTLRWNASEECDSYFIYRDSVKIGESVSGSFTDHFAVGHVTYQVRGIRSDGNYTMSNSVEVDASVSHMMIAAVDNPEWLDISLSASSLRQTTYNAAQAVTFKNYIGNALPSAEIGEHVSKTYNFDAAWPTKDRGSIEAFERLLGKLVCVKTPYDGRFVGILNPINRRENRFVTTFNASVTLVDWKEMGK